MLTTFIFVLNILKKYMNVDKDTQNKTVQNKKKNIFFNIYHVEPF